ncbi:hypothetical protein AB1Y20_005162 [Prymnesium parvum]|uniref:Fibronectin type-III domain-containing protein n=1 Tax=Prymnesium parvum TaxID=97485 RepID=A0AB34J5E3_PRYPA
MLSHSTSRRTALFLALAAVHADVYMQYPPGSNNRLAEGGGNRNNNNRLMDTQNNAKGGYGYGGTNTAAGKADPLQYMAGSKLSMMWTSQHSCGSENAECQIVIQYMCSGTGNEAPAGVIPSTAGVGEGPIRDGTNGGTPDPNNPDATRGLHEPTSFYQACDNRERNKGLYTADQNLNGDDARRTRQNPNGARSGLECPEERDYYPYWAPTPWKDAMILTNNLALCDFYKSESQNVKARGYCAGGNSNEVPNNPTGCTADGGTWTEVPAFGIPPPECVAAPFQRDNHLGSGPAGHEVMANLTIPTGALNGVTTAPNCVYRLRYNITTADTRVCSNSALTTKAECEAAGAIWSALYLDASHNDATLDSTPPLPDQNPRVNMGGLLTSGGGTDSLLELAINTNQYGRTFQDRSHVFSIIERPAALPENANIFNLNVKGKRGNIVQTYPATEYDFTPTDLVVGVSDYVHIQWTGNDNTNNNGNNNGEGTNNEDRHNIVQISNAGMDVPLGADEANMFDVQFEWNPDTSATFSGARDKDALVKQFALVKQTGCSTNNNNDQAADNCQKLNAAEATINLGLIKFKPGDYTYMSSRNNNFSNRAQKAKLHVLTAPTLSPDPPVNVRVEQVPTGDSRKAAMKLTWAHPGSSQAYVATDGGQYWGAEQSAAEVDAYKVEYSIDGGATWSAVQGCQTSLTSCTVDGLPAGTNTAFRVSTGNVGGFGEPTPPVAAKTADSSTSLECQQKLDAKLRNEGLSGDAVLAISLSVIAAIFALGFIIFIIRRRQPPPPPPPGMGLKGSP